MVDSNAQASMPNDRRAAHNVKMPAQTMLPGLIKDAKHDAMNKHQQHFNLSLMSVNIRDISNDKKASFLKMGLL